MSGPRDETRDEIFVGHTKDGCSIALRESQRCEHVQIVGATGRGKTMSVILPWMVQDFIRGRSLILIDGKGDPELPKMLQRYAPDQKVITFDLDDLENSALTNPLEYGSPQQVTDRIFATLEFEHSYFRDVSYEALLLVIQAIAEGGKIPTFSEIYRLLTNDSALTELATTLQAPEKTNSLKAQLLTYLAQSVKDRAEKISGLLAQIRPYATGELAVLLNGPIEGREYFSLSEIIREGNDEPVAVAVLIPTLLYQTAAARLGQMFLQEIAWALVGRKRPEFLPVYLDEFSAFVYRGFLQILNKARSSKVALHLSHQSLGDLEAIGSDFAKAVVTNTNIKCVLGVNDPESADFFANLFGTQTSTKTTERAKTSWFGRDLDRSGDVSVRDVEEYVIHPNRLKTFTRGQGVLRFMSHGYPLTEEVQFASVPDVF